MIDDNHRILMQIENVIVAEVPDKLADLTYLTSTMQELAKRYGLYTVRVFKCKEDRWHEDYNRIGLVGSYEVMRHPEITRLINGLRLS